MKKTNILKMAIILAVLLIVNETRAQITAHEAVKAMGRGINLGNTLEPEQEGGWNNGPAQEYYFDMYKEAGFQTVRVPIRWDKHVATTQPFAVNDDFMDRIEQIVDWGLSRDLIVVINCHHEESFKNNYEGQKERYDSIWSQIALRFKDKSEKLYFEMMNEPNAVVTQNQINEFNKRVLGIIRKTNPTRIVIYSGTGWSSANDLMNSAIPDTNDEYLMGYYHSYDPWGFAGEGNGTWGTEGDVREMVNRMSTVQTWSEENNIPVFIGEFGAQRLCDYNSRMYYYATYAEQALAHNQSFAAWDDGGDFETMLRADSVWNDIKDALIYSSDSSITSLSLKVSGDSAIQLDWVNRSDSSLVNKILIERRTLSTTFSVIAEFASVSSTTIPTSYFDKDAEIGEYSYYRVLEVYNNDTIPSYSARIIRISTDRHPYDGVIAIPGTIEAENYDVGGELNTYHDADVENVTAAYRLTEGVDIELRDDGGYQVGYVEDGEWMEYTVNVAQAGEYAYSAYVASEQTGGKFQLKFGGNTLSPITEAPNTGSWQTLDVAKGTVVLDAGEQVMRFTIKGTAAFNIDKIVFEEYVSVSEKNAMIAVYPNPAKSEINIVAEGYTMETLSVFNSNGQLVFHEIGAGSKAQVNIDALEQGIYFVVVNTKQGLLKESFVKH